MNCKFTHDHYKECLALAKAEGYEFFTLSEFDANKLPKRAIFLRHDIDLNLSLVPNFARIEHSLGIKATYFIRMHAPYNPFSYEGYQILKELVALGHEVGLHYEFGFADLMGEDEFDLVVRSKNALEAVLGKKIEGISAHEPARTGFVMDAAMVKRLGLKYEAYAPEISKNLKYISDSSARWREGCMCNHIGKIDRLYILTHPFWWYKRTSLENY